MKRNLSNVTKDHVRELKKWLKAEDKLFCPFNYNNILCRDDICHEVFPFSGGRCPCVKSGYKYSISVARLVIHKCQR